MNPTLYETQHYIVPSLSDDSGLLGFQKCFGLFMDVAAVHAEHLGVGLDVMLGRGQFWITTKTMIRFIERPRMMERVTLRTWPELPSKIRGSRSYQILRGDRVLVAGKTEWAVMDLRTKQLVTMDTVYPAGLDFPAGSACPEAFARIPEGFDDAAPIAAYTVRATDIDMAGHMNNVAYLRALLGCFSGEEQRAMHIGKMEVIFRSPCYEGEKLLLQQRASEAGTDFRLSKEDGTTALLVRITE